MRITIVCDVLGEENNGTTVAAMNLIRSLRSKGHTVTVVCPDENRKNEDGFAVVRRMNLGFLNNYVAKNGVILAHPDESVLKSAIANADVVHIMTPFFLAHKAAVIAKSMNKKITAGFHAQAENFTTHIFMMNLGTVNHLTYKCFYKSVFQYCDAIHYPTQFIRDVFEREIGIKTNGYVISNGVNLRFSKCDVQKPEQMKDKLVILFTGRYSKEKSHKILIDAVNLSKHRENIQLIFAGDGPQKKSIMEYSEKLPTMPLFRFFSREEMLRVLNYSDLYVHPAEIEIEAIACLEAVSCGLVPIISDSKRSATKMFALDSNNLFDSKSPQSLADRIDFFIDNPDVLDEYRRRYKGFAEPYRQDICMDKMEQMFFDVINSGDAS